MPSTLNRSVLDRDRRAIQHHYDVSNEFYELFLGPTMVYTCAYYRSPDGDLDQAQRDKLDLVCRKLRLEPGETFLDIGCGWGSLVLWAVKHYGVRAYGVTLSAEQASYAASRIRAEGLDGVCRVDCRDYREVRGESAYDKIAAVGIIEHVGPRNFPSYFSQARELLKLGGLFLNHGITHERHWQWTPQWDFLTQYVFPNADIANISQTLSAMEEEGWEIRDVEQLREHYSRTCRQWAERLRANHDRAVRLVSEKTFRTWLLYLTASSNYFADASIGLYQTVAWKSDSASRAVPTTREAIYTARRSEAGRRRGTGERQIAVVPRRKQVGEERRRSPVV
ncbi:MAG: class I SAM-dependent methyltransferase [Candidatus Binatia bacterium]